MIAAIVAVDKQYGIGQNGNLLIHIPEDMLYFKEKTSNNYVVMGRKTYDSLPVKPLPNRINIVLTRNNASNKEKFNGEVIYTDMDRLKVWISSQSTNLFNADVFIIGGGEIYRQLLPLCERIYLTKILNEYSNADTFFPNIDLMPEWKKISESEIREWHKTEYQFCIYENTRANKEQQQKGELYETLDDSTN